MRKIRHENGYAGLGPHEDYEVDDHLRYGLELSLGSAKLAWEVGTAAVRTVLLRARRALVELDDIARAAKR